MGTHAGGFSAQASCELDKDHSRISLGPCRSRVQHLGPSGAGFPRSQKNRLRMLLG